MLEWRLMAAKSMGWKTVFVLRIRVKLFLLVSLFPSNRVLRLSSCFRMQLLASRARPGIWSMRRTLRRGPGSRLWSNESSKMKMPIYMRFYLTSKNWMYYGCNDWENKNAAVSCFSLRLAALESSSSAWSSHCLILVRLFGCLIWFIHGLV